MMEENKKYVLDGFEYETKEDYESALNEQKGIQFLFKKYNMKDSKVATTVYNNAIEKELFKTQTGINFMYELRKNTKWQDRKWKVKTDVMWMQCLLQEKQQDCSV